MEAFTSSSLAPSESEETEVRLPEGLKTAAVLVVDDEPGMRSFLKRALERECALVEAVGNAEKASELCLRCNFDLVVLDIRLPGASGVDWLDSLNGLGGRPDVIFMTAYADVDTAVAALRAGAADFILKPFRLEQILASVRRCFERRRMARDNFLLKRRTVAEGEIGEIVGSSPAVRELSDIIRRVAPAPSTILVEGETGVGKELVATAIHKLSGRSGPFVPVNCGAIPRDLLESELFGHTRGAFTGAHTNREGLFSYAHGGTLFLDEVSELPLGMQAQLLRALEKRTIRPVGAEREVPVDVRVIAATNRRLPEEVAAGRFRQDLFYRLNVLALWVPPLRERASDIPALAAHFVHTLAPAIGVPPLPLTHADLQRIQAYSWPGNIRELKNVIERSLLLGRLPGDCLASSGQAGRGEPAAPDREVGPPVDWTLAQVEKHHLLRVLEASGGNKSEAARRLGISRKTLERKVSAWSAGGEPPREDVLG